jgi:dihydropteroate synthase
VAAPARAAVASAPTTRPGSVRGFVFPSLVGFPDIGRCRVMGVLNVTPDSFSDGGQFFDHGLAIEHGLELFAAGADIVDVGGESTRPGALRVDPTEELRRVLPVVRKISAAGPVSIDTMHSEIARQAVDAGAVLVNDVSGGLADPAMVPFVASSGIAYVVMHWRGHSVDMQTRAVYDDVVADVRQELSLRISAFLDAGGDIEQVVVDPGLGFAKKPESGHNWALLKHLDQIIDLGRPVLVGASRKAFLGHLLADSGGVRAPARRDHASSALTALLAASGAWGVRVHDVVADVDAVRVGARWRAQP